MAEHFRDIEKIQDILHEAQTGLWAIELEEGREPRMYADKAMLELLGFTGEPSPEECYRGWYDRIDADYYPMVQDVVRRMCADERAEVEYPWHHPLWGQIYVRCGGIRDKNYKEGTCLLGYHQNITNTVMLKQEYDTILEKLNENFKGIILCNLHTGEYRIIKATEQLEAFGEGAADFETFFRNYAEREIVPQNRELFLNGVNPEYIQKRFHEDSSGVEVIYRTKEKRWRRIKVVPLKQYSDAYPWVIAAMEEQDGEMEKQIDQASAQVAVSQIYTLLISVDCEKAEYNCMYYSGELLKLSRRGRYPDFREQAVKNMPAEDRREFERIFDAENYGTGEYREGMLHMYDQEGRLHSYSYYSALISQNYEDRILLTVKNVDDKYEIQRREAILANLCECYYSIYLFDYVNNTEEAIWQEDFIQKNREFPKGALDVYYEKFVKHYVYPEDQEKMRRAGSIDFLRQTLSVEQPVYEVDFRRIYPDSIRWVRARFSIAEIQDGVLTRVIFASMDINEQKLTELMEEQQKKLYFESQNIIKGLSAFYHSVFYVDLVEETFQTFVIREDVADRLNHSDEYGALFGIYYEHLIHEEDKERFKQEMCLTAIKKRVQEGETIYDLEYRRDYSGYYGWMRIHIILAESRNGAPIKIILASHNVEKEKEQEAQSQQALFAAYEAARNANEAKSHFMAQMSHDIRTPMNAIIGMTAIAMGQADNEERVKDCLQKISLSSSHLLHLINEVLDMSKIERGQITLTEAPFSLKGMFHEIGSIVYNESMEKGQALRFLTDDIIHDNLLGDAGKIRQVLINLINNAIKYTPCGGTITVTSKEMTSGIPGVGCFVFTVEDNGIGISEEFLDHIFVPFAREENCHVRKVQGTGLGMSISHGIVTAMQGSIRVESKQGAGSRFIVTLTIRTLEEEGGEAAVLRALSGNTGRKLEMCLQGLRLLLVEDNELNMEIAETLLRDAGFIVDRAENGYEALKLFNDSEPGTYDAILMDLQMPVMDGYTAASEIRSSSHPEAKTVPIIALTANAFAEDISKVMAAGMNDHVTKPIDFDRLLAALRKCICR
ncbi:response regulator [Hungatella hathewayi]|uniref:Stage 0 sporulation protein A homolog n=1 Tax=Hungatella hathewayi TaxID=154046 RepID=A0A173WII9_9FIRM|nr:response regulator [Hungatella hathewayi]CUN39303.1 His Kinase A (phosphoacceptor) domain./Histidine kinase-%2C DNA gyrase B-%2C and HSP90-like ATPase./Response regulator receiver domain [Hungatella hathewayi]